MVMQTFRVVLLVLLSFASAFGFEAKDYVTYFGLTSESITMEWTCDNCGADSYDVELFHVERGTMTARANTEQLQITMFLPRTGHYIARVRSVKDVCTENCYSEWVESIDPTYAKVGDMPRAWWVYGYVAPPGPIVIH